MDVRQLRYFKEIVDQGSISKAAEILHIAQPPLSQQLKKLETELGTVLIQRYRQKWELTETGEVLYEYAKQLLIKMEGVKVQIEEIEKGTAGTLRVGVSSACLNMLGDYLAAYRKVYPNVMVSIEKGNSEDLSRKLERKEIEIALLLRLEHSESYAIQSLGRQAYVVIAPANWEGIFENGRATFKDIAKYPFIMLGAMEGHSYYEDIHRAFAEENVAPNIIIESKDLTTVIAMVSKGLGLSIIPQAAYSMPMDRLITYELAQFDRHVEPILVKAKDERITKAAEQFWELAVSVK